LWSATSQLEIPRIMKRMIASSLAQAQVGKGPTAGPKVNLRPLPKRRCWNVHRLRVASANYRYLQASVGLKPPHEIEVVVEEAAYLRETQAHGQQVRRGRRRRCAG
jgi:hypothetical protein